MYIFTMFHKDWTIIVDFSLIAKLWPCGKFSATVSMYVLLYYVPFHDMIWAITYEYSNNKQFLNESMSITMYYDSRTEKNCCTLDLYILLFFFVLLVLTMALEDINSNSSILPNYDLAPVLINGECRSDVVMKGFIDIITNKDRKSVIGFLGKVRIITHNMWKN